MCVCVQRRRRESDVLKQYISLPRQKHTVFSIDEQVCVMISAASCLYLLASLLAWKHILNLWQMVKKNHLQCLFYLWPCFFVVHMLIGICFLEAKNRAWTAWFDLFWEPDSPPQALCQHTDQHECIPAIINWWRYACSQNLKHSSWLSESKRVIRVQGSSSC